MRRVNLLTLEVQLALLFQSLPFQRKDTGPSSGLLLDTLSAFQACCGRFFGPFLICSAHCLRFPDADPTPHTFRTVCLSN